TSLRERGEVREEATALSTQARLSAMVMGIAPVGAATLSFADGGGSAAVLMATVPGRVCLAAGLLLEALSLAWMRRILRVTE
ncbi:MAG: type II secretion system F family protein, partial [Acidimicrobiia bacterium]